VTIIQAQDRCSISTWRGWWCWIFHAVTGTGLAGKLASPVLLLAQMCLTERRKENLSLVACRRRL